VKRARSGGVVAGRAGGHRAFAGGDDEMAVRVEAQHDVTGVDLCVVANTDWCEVREVGEPAVSPPPDVMQLRSSELHVAPRDHACGM
jgi:alkanesulfonate monooxygenase SsuD/methylene tetrahydromethanopterin reductase-like flavin-dependent oxidoreductase (luciferase family)